MTTKVDGNCNMVCEGSLGIVVVVALSFTVASLDNLAKFPLVLSLACSEVYRFIRSAERFTNGKYKRSAKWVIVNEINVVLAVSSHDT
jgi:uncharacterized membrane protein